MKITDGQLILPRIAEPAEENFNNVSVTKPQWGINNISPGLRKRTYETNGVDGMNN